LQLSIRRALFVVGVSLVVAGLCVALRIPYFYIHAHAVSTRLLRQAATITESSAANTSELSTTPVVLSASTPLAMPASSALLGQISIPKLHVTAPILQGTQDVQLNVAAGHLTTSALPGDPGTSVIAAHNATWFRHVDQLRPGDVMTISTKAGTFTFAVVSSQVLHVGDALANTALPSLVLESCYPLDALYLTPERFIVSARLLSSQANTNELKTEWQNAYSADIPANLVHEQLTLSQNSLPMGTLTYSGTPADSFIQGSAPLSATNAITQLYSAWVHASIDQNLSDLHALWPTAPLQALQSQTTNPLYGISAPTYRLNYTARFDITLHVDGMTLESAAAVTRVQIGSTAYDIQFSISATGQKLHIQNVQMQPISH